MTPHPRPLPDQIRSRPFHISEALRLGVSPARLRAQDLISPFSGVRVPRDLPATLRNWCASALLVLPDHAAFSHTTAAALWGIPLPSRHETAPSLHVSTDPGYRPPRLPNVTAHRRSGRASISVITELPVHSADEVWCELGRFLTVDELVAAADYLVCSPITRAATWSVPGHRRPLCTPDELHRAVTARRRVGVERLRTALPLIRLGVESPRETHLRLALTRAGLPEPEVNVPIHDSEGRLIAIVDLYFRRFRVAVEYEGAHHRGEEDFAKDLRRYERLAQAGVFAVRIDSQALADGAAEAVRRTREALIMHGWRP